MYLHYFIVAFFAGFVSKIQDDLSDNPLLEKFKSPTLMEFLKGVHYILLTTVSLHNPVFFMLLYLFACVNSLSDPNAWSGPYESSLLYAFGIVFLLINYDQLHQLNIFDVCFIIAILVPSVVAEPYATQHKEYSLMKFITRAYFVCIILCMMILPLHSITLKYFYAWCLGYCLCSTFVQYYSLHKTKKKRSKRY